MAKQSKIKDQDLPKEGEEKKTSKPEESHIVTLNGGSLPEGRVFEVLDNGKVRVKESDLEEGERFKEINGKMYIEYSKDGQTFLL